MELPERLRLLRKSLNLKQEVFAESLGLKQGSYSDIERGRVKTLSESVVKLLKLNYKVNPDWLLNEKGDMLLEREPQKEESSIRRLYTEYVTTAPLISQYAHAGYLSGYADTEYIEQQPVYAASKKFSNGNYVAFEIRGDSMEDGQRHAIYNSDIVLGRELVRDYWKSKIHIPKTFVIVHRTKGITCKEIIDHDFENGIITCHSFNPDYKDFELNLRDVVQLFYIKEIKREP